MRIKDVKNRIVAEISFLYDLEEATNIAEWLLEDSLQLTRIQLQLRLEDTITDNILTIINEKIAFLKTAQPIQQVIGYTYFYGLKLKVNSATLIPRPETEELVSLILNDIEKNTQVNILDIGTGSGCIALALQSKLPLAIINALDISNDALLIAKQNAIDLNFNTHFFQADILTSTISENYLQNEIIVSNPPYIHIDEKNDMHINVINYEPHSALFVYDEDVLLYYKKIIQFAKEKNRKSSTLYFEINEAYGEQLITYLHEQNITDCILIKDMQGKNRFIKAKILID